MHDGPWNSVLPTLAGAPESAFDLDAAARVVSHLKPVERWDTVVVAAHVPVAGALTPIVPAPVKDVAGAMHIFLNEASVQAVFGANSQVAAAQIHVTLTAGRLVSLVSQGLDAEEACGGFFIYGLADEGRRAGVPAFVPSQALAPIRQTLAAIVVLARARNGQVSPEAVVEALSDRVFFYSGAWLSDDDTLAAVEIDGRSVVPLFLSPTTLLKSAAVGIGAGAGTNVATISLAEALRRTPDGADVTIEPGAGYSVTLD